MKPARAILLAGCATTCLFSFSGAFAQQVDWGILNRNQPDFFGSAMRGAEAGRAERGRREADEAARREAEQRGLAANAEAQAGERERSMHESILKTREQNMPKMAEMVKVGDCQGAFAVAFSYGDVEVMKLLNQGCRPAGSSR